MFNNEIEFEINLNEKKNLEKKTKEKQNKRKNSKGRYNLQNKIKLIKPNINLNDNISATNRKRIRKIEKVEDFEKIEKKKKITSIRQMMERINLDSKYDYSQLKYSEIEKRKLRIFGDMSSSEISKNLFKSYFPCIIPPYYTNQIKNQIIINQIDKITKKLKSIRKLNNNEISKIENKKYEKLKIKKSHKINNNNNFIHTNNNNKNIISNSIREFIEKNCEYINESDNDELIKKEQINEYENENNNENNSRNTYQEEERSVSEEAYNGDIENNSFDDGENYYDYIPNDDKMDSREYDYINYKKQYRDN